LDRVRALVEEDHEWGWGPEDSVLLDAAATGQRIAMNGAVGARFTPHCARVQPARLVHGLAAAAVRAGVVIHEQTRADAIEPRAVRTARGTVSARFVIRATEGYTAQLPGLRRTLLPLRSCMIVTEPLGSDVWSELGWQRCETLHDGQRRYSYLQRTADGRVAIGGRGTPYHYGSRIDEGPLEQSTVEELRSRLAGLFPILRGARIDGAWHGVLGVPRDWRPSVGLDRATGLAWAGGYVGRGVAAANLAARTLRDLILERDSELTRLPWVGEPFPRWEPEPLRFVGVRSTYALMGVADRRETRTGRTAIAARVAELVAGVR
jgi:glycine/D-amino acid oxidase-like deaminating enzyme